MIICDLLFSRYGSNAERVLKMEPRRGLEFCQTAEKQRQDERLFLRWINGYQTEMNFQEFKQRAMAAAVPETSGKQMTESEIYEKVRGILKRK